MPADTQQDLKFVTLNDFSPGIYDDWYSGAQAAPQGAAQLSGTYGCVSAQGGGLIPAPRRVNRILESPQSSPSAQDPYTHITAFRNLSPVYDRTGLAADVMGTVRSYPDQLFVAFEWYDSTNHHKQISRTYKPYKLTFANPGVGSVTTYDIMSSTSTNIATQLYYGFSSFEVSRNNPSDSTAPGYPTVGCSYTDSRDYDTLQKAVMYPNPSTPTTDSSTTMAGLQQSGGIACYSLFAHQDRMLQLGISVNFGFATGGELPFDGLNGTAPNDFSTIGFTVSTFVNENPGLFGSWCSVNASEAIMIKQQHGGYDIRGDVSNPTIVRLPGLEPTGDAVNIGTLDRSGNYVYGTRTGVFAWNGGSTSTLVSPQFDGWFWKPGSGITGVDNYLFTKGSFSRLGRYIYAPNNFMFDQETGGWWRLNDTSANPTYAFWDVSAGGYVIGVPTYLSASQQVLADYYDPTQGQSSFSWTSQPLQVTQGRVVDFREIDLVAEGTGSVVITITGLGGATRSETFVIASSGQPVTINQMTSLQAHDAYVSIVSTATSSSNPAPRIFRCTFGYSEEMTARPAQ